MRDASDPPCESPAPDRQAGCRSRTPASSAIPFPEPRAPRAQPAARRRQPKPVLSQGRTTHVPDRCAAPEPAPNPPRRAPRAPSNWTRPPRWTTRRAAANPAATRYPARRRKACRAAEPDPHLHRPKDPWSGGFRLLRVGRPAHRRRPRRAPSAWRGPPALRSVPAATTGHTSSPLDRPAPAPLTPAHYPAAPKDVRPQQLPMWRAPADPAASRPAHPVATPTAGPRRGAARDIRRGQRHPRPPTRDRPATAAPATRTSQPRSGSGHRPADLPGPNTRPSPLPTHPTARPSAPPPLAPPNAEARPPPPARESPTPAAPMSSSRFPAARPIRRRHARSMSRQCGRARHARADQEARAVSLPTSLQPGTKNLNLTP